MSSKLSQNKHHSAAPKLSKSDMDFYKMSVLFFLLCGAILLILKVSTTLTARQASGANVAYELYTLFRNPVYIVSCGVLLAASVIWFIASRIRKVNEGMRAISSTNALAIMLYVTFFSAYFGLQIVNNAGDCLFALAATLILGLLYYISKIYHRDFLAFSIENALLAMFLYRYWHLYTARAIAGKVLLIVAFAIVGAVLAAYFKKHLNRPHAAKKSGGALMFPYFVSLVIFAVFMFIKLPDITGAPLVNSGTMLTVLLVQYIVFAIIYTMKLIRE